MLPANIDQSKVEGAMAAMRIDGLTERQRHEAEIFDLGRQVGGIQLSQITRHFSAVAEIKLFAEIKESNKFKELAIRQADGTSAVAENIEDFCKMVFGVGYKAMNEESLTLRALGDVAYESANRLGLNRKQLRMIRSLPDTHLNAVTDALASDSKPEVVAIIEELASQLSKAKADLSEAAAEKVATEKLMADKNAKIDRMSRHVAKSTPDLVMTELQKESTALMNDALGCVRGQIRQSFIAIKNNSSADYSIFMAGLVGQLQADLTALREEFNLPDVSTARDQELAAEVSQWAFPKDDVAAS